MVINNRNEIWFTRICLFLTLGFVVAIFGHLALSGWAAFNKGDYRLLTGVAISAVTMFFVAYGNLLYQICLIGYHKRREKHTPVSRDVLEAVYDGNAPSLSILIPSYKEERKVILQTLLSAALAEYPSKKIVLLIDDPIRPNVLEDIVKLDNTRLIPGQLQYLFDNARNVYAQEQAAFQERLLGGKVHGALELNRLSMLYDDVAQWLFDVAADCREGVAVDALNHTDKFFNDAVLDAFALSHKKFANQLRKKIVNEETISTSYLQRHYARLTGMFTVQFSSFERKKYINLSHEANKAMNLNSYITLMGKSWKEVQTKDGIELRQVLPNAADFSIAATDYINTIDADSMMLNDYALRLVHIMEEVGNDKIAVIQSPCSSFPGCPNTLERAAGACIDVQFNTHQGYTRWNASAWVGANAMLRRAALEEIKEQREEEGKTVTVYIQDRTVIEDTESTIDLAFKGWRIFNYPERLTFSSTPPDFGSLLIQRRRWANGGMIILPKLLAYAWKAPKNLQFFKEFFMRFHYLVSTTMLCLVSLLFVVYPSASDASTLLFPLSILPSLVLFARDLRNAGYKVSETWRIYSMYLMLMPIMLGGVLKQFQQIITGKKIPFGRTPKVTGRTAAPALYCLIEVALTLSFISATIINMEHHMWVQAGFSGLNAALMSYALVYFIGINALMEDITTSIKVRWRNVFYHAEILTMPARRRMAKPFSVVRKRA